MLADYPDAPFRIADDTTEQQRVDILQDLGARGAKSPALNDLASRVWARITALGDSSVRSVASEALNAVQHLEYHPHPAGIEQFQKVDYTLANGGNCEDLSTALVALLMRLGITARAVWIPQPDRDLNHVAVQVQVSPSEWLWADPSIAGAKLGEDPYSALRRLSPNMHPADLEFRAKRAYGMRPAGQATHDIGSAPPAVPTHDVAQTAAHQSAVAPVVSSGMPAWLVPLAVGAVLGYLLGRSAR